MTYADIKDLTAEELRKRVLALREELFQTKMKHSLGQVSNPIEIRGKRRDIARIQTALSAKVAR